MSSIVVWQKRRQWRGTDSCNLSAIGDKNAWAGPQRNALLFFSFFLICSLIFFLGPAFVCLSQAFCCEGSELILLIVLLGRNLDLNLLWNLVPDMPPLDNIKAMGWTPSVRRKGVFGTKNPRKVRFWGPVWEKWEELVGLSRLLSMPNLSSRLPKLSASFNY